MQNKELIGLLTKIHDKKGLDFTQYKEATLVRRIGSRLSKCGVKGYKEYGLYLDDHPDEYNELLDALTINVTELFRNPEIFAAIDKEIIPVVIDSKKHKGHCLIRAWSCGCSKGDEVYSLAILFNKAVSASKEYFRVTIYGTDIDPKALDTAKKCTYSLTDLEGIGPDLIKRYFEKLTDGSYTLKRDIKDMAFFRVHDAIKDRPLLNCDVIFCRNLLIYFNKELQEEILLKFYECLNPGGFLVLGMVESLAGSSAKRFETVDNRLRIYRRPLDEKPMDEMATKLSQDQIDRIVGELLGKH